PPELVGDCLTARARASVTALLASAQRLLAASATHASAPPIARALLGVALRRMDAATHRIRALCRPRRIRRGHASDACCAALLANIALAHDQTACVKSGL